MSFKGAFEPPCNHCNGDHSVVNCPYLKPKPSIDMEASSHRIPKIEVASVAEARDAWEMLHRAGLGHMLLYFVVTTEARF